MLNLVQLARGSRKTMSDMSNITATTTSINQEAKSENAIILYVKFVSGSGTWTVKIQGRDPLGNYMDMYNDSGELMALSAITASQGKFIAGIPKDFKIVAVEDGDGAEITVSYELMSV